MCTLHISFLFFFNNTATTEIYTLSLHDALPICSNFKSIAELQGEEYVVLHAKLMHVYNAPTRSGKKMTKATASDGSGFIEILWFGMPYLQKSLKLQEEYIFIGTVKRSMGSFQMKIGRASCRERV